MQAFLTSRARSFCYAFHGWWFVIRTQQNAWIHALATILVVLLCAWLKLDRRDWAVIIVAIMMVWTSEFINTAIEAVVDLASPQQHHLARISKDVGAAAVLIAASGSVLIGLLLIGPLLWQRLVLILPGK